LEQLLDDSFIVMHREDENFRARLCGAYLSGRLHAVDERQRVVDYGDIWFGLQRLLNRLLPVSGLSHHLPVRPSLNDMAQSRSDHIVVVCDQDSDHRGKLPTSSCNLKGFPPPATATMSISLITRCEVLCILCKHVLPVWPASGSSRG